MAEKESPSGIEAEVLALLRQGDPGEAPSIDMAACCLGISSRTLQRRLANRALTFRGLVDAVRLEVAIDLLTGSQLPISEISARLGYSTPSGFCRAFARWTGSSPSDVRRSRPVRTPAME